MDSLRRVMDVNRMMKKKKVLIKIWNEKDKVRKIRKEKKRWNRGREKERITNKKLQNVECIINVNRLKNRI